MHPESHRHNLHCVVNNLYVSSYIQSLQHPVSCDSLLLVMH